MNKKLKDLMDKRTRTEVFSRIVGYIRPVQQWNEGKAAEYKDRKVFKSKEEV